MQVLLVKWSLVVLAFLSALMSWRTFQGDVLYNEIAENRNWSPYIKTSKENTYPPFDVRLEIAESSLLERPTNKPDAVNDTIRLLRSNQFKEPIDEMQINNLVRHESSGYRTGYNVNTLVNYALSVSRNRHWRFENAFDLALVRFFELSPGVRLRAIALCNESYLNQPPRYRKRIIQNIVDHNLARIVYQNSYQQDLMRDLFPYL